MYRIHILPIKTYIPISCIPGIAKESREAMTQSNREDCNHLSTWTDHTISGRQFSSASIPACTKGRVTPIFYHLGNHGPTAPTFSIFSSPHASGFHFTLWYTQAAPHISRTSSSQREVLSLLPNPRQPCSYSLFPTKVPLVFLT